MAKVIMISCANSDKGNINEAGKTLAKKAGRILNGKGLFPVVTVTSPSRIAQDTLVHLCKGLEVEINPESVQIMPEFASVTEGPWPYSAEDMKEIRRKAKGNRRSVADQLLSYDEVIFKDHNMRRGEDGAERIRELVQEHPDGIILIVSHTGNRIEPVVLNLKKERNWLYASLRPCEALIFDIEEYGKPENLEVIKVEL